jgi:CheY-like chemotaxis protein
MNTPAAKRILEGLELIQDVRKQYPGIPVIAISGGLNLNEMNVWQIAKCLGAEKALVKPFSKDELLSAVHELLHP